MKLATFSDKRGATTIKAADLDANFSKLKPLTVFGNSQKQYSLTETPAGWSLMIFPPFPTDGAMYVLSIKDGMMQWTSTQSCDT